jgi:hypothetical protein
MEQLAISDEQNGLFVFLGIRDVADPGRSGDEAHVARDLTFPALQDGPRCSRPPEERNANADSVDPNDADELGLPGEVREADRRDLRSQGNLGASQNRDQHDLRRERGSNHAGHPRQ